jgi:hypothetical protein
MDFFKSCFSCSIEEVALAAPKARKWFQLYIYKERHVSRILDHTYFD